MARTAYPKTNLNAGEFSPLLLGRYDVDKYENGTARMMGWLPLPFGGARHTPGQIFVNEVRDSSKEARLVDWVFGKRQAYMLQFNDDKIRFYKNKAIIFGDPVPLEIIDITNADPGVVTTGTNHGFANGDIIKIEHVDGMFELNGNTYRVANVTMDTFELTDPLTGDDIDTTNFGEFIIPTDISILIHANVDDFQDNSIPPVTITPHGDVQISEDFYRMGGASIFFDGAGDYIDTPDAARFDFSGGVFTMDFWIRPLTAGVAYTLYEQKTDNDNRFTLQLSENNSIYLKIYAAGVLQVDLESYHGSVPINEWSHIGVQEDGDNWRIFINGFQSGRQTSSNRAADYSGNIEIGRQGVEGIDFYGYLDEFRITKGHARFTEDVYGDVNTMLMLHFNDALHDHSQFTATGTLNGDAQIVTDEKKFGFGSLLLDGTADYISYPDAASWNFSGGNFTFECWLKMTDQSVNRSLLYQQTNSLNYISCYINTEGRAVFEIVAAGAVVVSLTSAVGSIPLNEWTHFAIVENGNSYNIFINGVINAAVSDTSRAANYTGELRIGLAPVGAGYKGYIDELRISNIARWTSTFTVPTFEYFDYIPPTEQGFSANSVQSIYEIDHPYDDDELFDIQYAQAADIMYLAHGDVWTQKLSRFDDNDWTIGNVDFQDGPYLDENETTTTLDPSGSSGAVTVTASATTGINDGQGFLTTDVGRLIRFYDGTDWGWLKITARTSTTVVDATVVGYKNIVGDALSGHGATKRWALGAWSDTTGYPRACTFFQGRLWFGGTRTQPQNIWGSQPRDFENFGPGEADDGDAVTYELNSNQVNIINWLASGKRLVVGTEGENFTVYSGNSSEPITPTNIKADSETNYGSAGVTPVKIGSYHYYIQDDLKTLREFYYDFSIDAYRSINKSIVSEHITQAGVKQIAYQKAPFGVLWAVLNDGKLASFTREIEQEVNGWADQATRSGDSYKSVATIPVEGYNETWFIVERIIGGQPKKYVEYQVNPKQDDEEEFEDMVLLESALQFMGGTTRIVSGLLHLEGETVGVFADGTFFTAVVQGGQVNLVDEYQGTITVGLLKPNKIKLLPMESGSTIGTAQSLLKKTSKIMMRVNNSLGLKVGEESANVEELFTDGDGVVILDEMQTGDFEVPCTIGWDAKNQLYIEQARPFPATILLIVQHEFTAEEKT